MKENVKLTKFSSGAGWACKLSPEDLSQVLGNLNNINKGDSIIDFSSFDDAAAFNISGNTILQTVDFFTPIVDDPYEFGKIASGCSSTGQSLLIPPISNSSRFKASSSIWDNALIKISNEIALVINCLCVNTGKW